MSSRERVLQTWPWAFAVDAVDADHGVSVRIYSGEPDSSVTGEHLGQGITEQEAWDVVAAKLPPRPPEPPRQEGKHRFLGGTCVDCGDPLAEVCTANLDLPSASKLGSPAETAGAVPHTPGDVCWCQPFDGPRHPDCPMHKSLPEPVSTEGALCDCISPKLCTKAQGTLHPGFRCGLEPASCIAPVPARDAEVHALIELNGKQLLFAKKLVFETIPALESKLTAADAVIEEMRAALQELRGLAQRQGWIHVAIQQADRAIRRADSYRTERTSHVG